MSTATPNGGSAAAPTEPGTVVAAPGRFVDGTFTSDAGTLAAAEGRRQVADAERIDPDEAGLHAHRQRGSMRGLTVTDAA